MSGQQLEAGNYDLITKELPVRRLNTADEVYMNTSGVSSMYLAETEVEIDAEFSISVELYEVDTIVTEHPVMLEKH